MIIDTRLCKNAFSLISTICYFQKYPSLLFSSIKCFTSNTRNDGQQSFIVSYLVNNCGLSPKSALSASKHLHFKTPDKPDSTLAFLKSHGFSDTQITKIVCRRPSVLSSDPENTLLPKIKFFHSKGFSGPDIARILSICPEIMHSSVENMLIPAFNVVQNLIRSDDKVIPAIRRLPKIMLSQSQDSIIPNIKLLEETGLPHSSIVWLLRYHPLTFMIGLDRFSEIVEEVKGMGFNPSTISFAIAIQVIRAMSKSAWEKKFDIYKRWGWSKEETVMAFRKHPWCMVVSEEKITTMMNYYINKMGWVSSSIAEHPLLISLSLDKRVIPRCSVIQVLQSKDQIKLTSVPTFLKVTEKSFLHKFVKPFKKEAPQLLKLYQDKLNAAKCKDMEIQR